MALANTASGDVRARSVARKAAQHGEHADAAGRLLAVGLTRVQLLHAVKAMQETQRAPRGHELSRAVARGRAPADDAQNKSKPIERKRMRGRRVLMESFVSHGVRHIFGNPGTTETPLLDSLPAFPQLEYIMALHGGVAVSAASFYAQASGRVTVANLHVAPRPRQRHRLALRRAEGKFARWW